MELQPSYFYIEPSKKNMKFYIFSKYVFLKMTTNFKKKMEIRDHLVLPNYMMLLLLKMKANLVKLNNIILNNIIDATK